MYVICFVYSRHFQQRMDQPGMLAIPACGQLNRGDNAFPPLCSRLRIWSRETDSVVPSPARSSSSHSGRIWCLLTGFFPLSATASKYTASHHRIGPKFIGSRKGVPMALTTESPPVQGQTRSLEKAVHIYQKQAQLILPMVQNKRCFPHCDENLIQTF